MINLKLPARLLKNQEVITYGSIKDRRIFENASYIAKYDAIEERIEKGWSFIYEHRSPSSDLVEETIGYKVSDFQELPIVENCVSEMKRACSDLPDRSEIPGKDSMYFVSSSERDRHLTGHEIDVSSYLYEFAKSPEILVPVIRYLGMFPVLYNIAIYWSPNDTVYSSSSQSIHRDGEATRSMKVFLYATDVDESSGPLCVLSAENSKIFESITGFSLGRKSDSEFEKIFGENCFESLTGPEGTCIFIDTNRCYHFGSRKGGKPRIVGVLHYLSPVSPMYPIGEKGKFITQRSEHLVLSENLTDFDKLLLGLSL